MRRARYLRSSSRKRVFACGHRELSSTRDIVICVHGYLSHGTGMYLIKRRLEREYGMQVELFSYPSVRGALDENAAALAAFINKKSPDSAHIIGHSLGGVLALRMHANNPNFLPGRVVCLGSPLTGSRAASYLNELKWAEDIVGRTVPDAMVNRSANEWAVHVAGERDIGVIAGNVPFGIGRFLANFKEDNDGTIAVAETRLKGAKEHIVLPVSHKGMLVSADVADQAAAFIRRGGFLKVD